MKNILRKHPDMENVYDFIKLRKMIISIPINK